MNSLPRYVAVLVKHRRFLFWETVLVTVAIAAYSLVVPHSYTSSALILPPTDESAMLSLSSALGSAGVSNMLRLGGSLRGTQSSDLIAAVLGSRTVRERVIDTTDFIRIARIRKGREAALRELSNQTRIGVSDDGIIALSVKARTREYAARLASAYVSELDDFLRVSNMTRGKNLRIFLEQRFAQSDSDLTEAEDSLTVFQKRHRVTAVTEEIRAAVDVYARLQAERLAQDVEVRFAESVGGNDNPYVRALRQRSDEFGRQLARLELGSTGSGVGVGFGLPLQDVPEVAAEYTRRLADYRVKLELRELLVQQYEQARITEVRDTPVITVLDPPRVPERRSYPKRTRMTLFAFAVALVVGIAMSFIAEAWEGQKRNPLVWSEWQRIAQALRLNRGIGRRIFSDPPAG